MYFDELMRIATSPNLVISVDTMHQYVPGLTTLKTMMHMLLDELDKGARAVYLDFMEERVHFHKYVALEYTNNITSYRARHQFAIVDHHEDVQELVFPQLSEP